MSNIKKIEKIVWKDAIAFRKRELSDDTFCIISIVTVGIVDREDKEKIRVIYGLNLSKECDENDFINIPKTWIIERKVLGSFNMEIKETKNE